MESLYIHLYYNNEEAEREWGSKSAYNPAITQAIFAQVRQYPLCLIGFPVLFQQHRENSSRLRWELVFSPLRIVSRISRKDC